MNVNPFKLRPGIWQGFPKDDRAAIISIAKAAIRDGTLRPATAEELKSLKIAMTASTFPPEMHDITPKGVLGGRTVAVEAFGTVFVGSTPVVPDAQTSWQVAGKLNK